MIVVSVGRIQDVPSAIAAVDYFARYDVYRPIGWYDTLPAYARANIWEDTRQQLLTWCYDLGLFPESGPWLKAIAPPRTV